MGLGAGKWHIIRTIVLPCSIDGIVTGCILAVGRIVGESAALLFTAGAAEVIAKGVLKAYTSNGATLSVLLYLRAFEDGDFASAWGIGAVLLVLVLGHQPGSPACQIQTETETVNLLSVIAARCHLPHGGRLILPATQKAPSQRELARHSRD